MKWSQSAYFDTGSPEYASYTACRFDYYCLVGPSNLWTLDTSSSCKLTFIWNRKSRTGFVKRFPTCSFLTLG